MNHTQLQASMPGAAFFYFGVPQDVINNLPAGAYWGQTAGTLYCGTLAQVAELSAYEITA